MSMSKNQIGRLHLTAFMRGILLLALTLSLPGIGQPATVSDPFCGTDPGLILAAVAAQSPKAPVDAKNITTGQPAPDKDPGLVDYARYKNSAPLPSSVEAVPTQLPFSPTPGQRIAFIGNTLFDRDADFGHFETLLHQRFPNHELVLRNLAWSADEIDLQPRPDNFATLEQQLTIERVDVIIAAFGFNESFAGQEGVSAFRKRLTDFLKKIKTSAFNGESAPYIFLVSPIANENVAGVPAADLNNDRLQTYTETMREVASNENVGFIDAYAPTQAAMASPGSDLTFNGIHLEANGYEVFGRALYEQLLGEKAPEIREALRLAVVERNRQYFRRYRPLNTFYYTGGRNKSYGYLDFLPAMKNFDIMVSNRDRRIWDMAQGKPVPPWWMIQTCRQCLPPLRAEVRMNGYPRQMNWPPST